jgi:uncharacterized membrane protein YphA (DoxX/SURF4 family)
VLRLVAGGTAIVEGLSFFLAPVSANPGVAAIGTIAIVAGAALLVGILAPVAGTIVAAGGIGLATSIVPPPAQHPLNDAPSLVLLTAVAFAIVLLGPGALSIDSYLFGRREIVIPPDLRSADQD